MFDGANRFRESATSCTAASIALSPVFVDRASSARTIFEIFAETDVQVDAGVAICVSGIVDVTDSVSAAECCSEWEGESIAGKS